MEQIGSYYNRKYGLDFRSLRYPGFVSPYEYEANGTTDYASQIFFNALKNTEYKHYLTKDRKLSMIYLDDGIDGTIDFLKADSSKFTSRIYNLNGLSFTPEEISKEIKNFIPNLKYSYEPDFRENIAASWPNQLESQTAFRDWGWKPRCDNVKKLVIQTLIDIAKNKEYFGYFKGNNYNELLLKEKTKFVI